MASLYCLVLEILFAGCLFPKLFIDDPNPTWQKHRDIFSGFGWQLPDLLFECLLNIACRYNLFYLFEVEMLCSERMVFFSINHFSWISRDTISTYPSSKHPVFRNNPRVFRGRIVITLDFAVRSFREKYTKLHVTI